MTLDSTATITSVTPLQEVIFGLAAEPRQLPSKLLYDETGSYLFKRITEQPEYYVTRTETALLSQCAADIVAALPQSADDAALVEFGANDENKAVKLLDAPKSRFTSYTAIDISPTGLSQIPVRMQSTHPGIEVHTVAADFLQPLALNPASRAHLTVGFFPGSTIGQLDPPTAVRFLIHVRQALTATGPAAFIVGTDICNDAARLIPAYNDAAGVQVAFNRNMLQSVNRLAGCNFDPTAFSHRALWNDQERRMEFSLESHHAQTVQFANGSIDIAAGERIRTGISYKYTRERFIEFAIAAGWLPGGFWQDSQSLFGIHLLLCP